MAWTSKGSILGPPGLDGATARIDPDNSSILILDTGGEGGADAREIELSSNSTHLIWRYVGDANWVNLIALTAIQGPQGIRGVDGVQGVQGLQGVKGDTGAQGAAGVNNLLVVNTLADVPPGTPVDTVIVTR